MIKYNCKNCTKRYLGCHDKCEDYQKAKKENNEIKRKMKFDSSINYTVLNANLSTKSHNINKNK